MKSNHLISIVTAGMLFCIGNGCSTPEGAYTPVYSEKGDMESHHNVVFMSKGIEKSLDVSGIKKTKLADGRLKATVNLRSRDDRRIQVQVRCIFKDEDGFSTGDETPWKTLILTEKSQETVSYTSMNDKAAKFTISVRESR